MNPRRLCLIRHAQAASSAPDADRPLTARGADDAARIGQWLGDAGVAPDRVVVSPSLRTRQTWERAATGLPGAPEPDLDPRLYRNTLDDYLDVVRETDETVATLVVVGHAPSVAALALELLDPGREPPAFPAGGAALLAVPGRWAALGTGAATLAAAHTPPR